MKLSVVVTVLGQHDMSTVAIQHLLENATDPNTNVVVVDNGGDFECSIKDPRLVIERCLGEDAKAINQGVYPIFKYAMNLLPTVDGDIVAFLHSDVIITEKGFDTRVLDSFRQQQDLGLIGFVGSDEIDFNGGRGSGTTSNFQGGTYSMVKSSVGGEGEMIVDPSITWKALPAEAHGRRNAGYTKAAVVDGCVMIVRRTAWDKIGFREDFPPHHFYDRLISTQMLEAGFKVAVLGIAFDHLGGQTVCRESRYHDIAREWCERHGVAPKLDAEGKPNWDLTIYLKGEADWLREYRDTKHLVPIKV